MLSARLLEQRDILDIVALAKEHHAASRYAHIPFEGERVYRLCGACLEYEQYGAALLVDDDDKPVGYCLITVEPYMWSDLTIARELALYITLKARSYPAFKTLIECAESLALLKGAHTVDFGMTTPTDEPTARRYGKLYVSMGYEWHGETYRKELSR